MVFDKLKHDFITQGKPYFTSIVFPFSSIIFTRIETCNTSMAQVEDNSLDLELLQCNTEEIITRCKLIENDIKVS